MENVEHIKLNDETLKQYPDLMNKQTFKEVFFLKEDDNYHKKGAIIAAIQKEDNKLICYPEYETLFDDEYNIEKIC